MDDFSLDSHTRLLVHVQVVCLKEHLRLLLRHIRGHLRYEVYRNYLALLVVVLLELESQADHLLSFLSRQFMRNLSQQDTTFLSDLHSWWSTSR
jgi:hypothetical protein